MIFIILDLDNTGIPYRRLCEKGHSLQQHILRFPVFLKDTGNSKNPDPGIFNLTWPRF
jgi:hypothetical protein